MSLKDNWNALRRRLERRLRLNAAYGQVFGATPAARSIAQDVVLDDLRNFCGATKPPARGDRNGRGDPLLTGIAIGRQEVFFRLMEHLHVDEKRLYQLHNQQIEEASDAAT